MGLDYFNDTLMAHFWRVQKPRIKQSNLDSFFKKLDKHPPTDEAPTGQSTKMSRNDDSSNVNNCPSRCNTMQSIYYSASSLYMFRLSTTPTIRSTQNWYYSLRYCAATSLQRGKVGHVEGM